jgi:2-oxoglutarate dehydrogenase E1 component
VRAKQDRRGDTERTRVVPLLIHGDAAFIGQGVVAETLNLANLEGYSTGGTIHVVINNQVGFTTNARGRALDPLRTDLARMLGCPVFHVNGEDPEAVAQVARSRRVPPALRQATSSSTCTATASTATTRATSRASRSR